MENIRLRAELARVTMERDILHPTDEDLSTGTPVWEKPRRTSRRCSDEVRLDGATQAALAGERTVPGSERERVGISSTPGAAEEVLTRRHLSETALLVKVRAVYAEARGAYGWPRVWRQLKACGVRVGKLRVQLAMRQNGIRGRGKRRFRLSTTDSTMHWLSHRTCSRATLPWMRRTPSGPVT